MVFGLNEIIFFQKIDVDLIVDQSIKHLPKEACGLIGAEKSLDGSTRLIIFPTINRSNIINRFFIPDYEINSIETMCRFSGYDLCGCYHSHTKGPDIPSPVDIKNASKSKLKVWAIYSVRLNRLSVYDLSKFPTKIQYQTL